MYACWFQPGLISHDTVFSSHSKPTPAGLINPETNQRTGWITQQVNNVLGTAQHETQMFPCTLHRPSFAYYHRQHKIFTE